MLLCKTIISHNDIRKCLRLIARNRFDIRHMPQGCGTWPAAWETNEAIWPNGGEVDIVRSSSRYFFLLDLTNILLVSSTFST